MITLEDKFNLFSKVVYEKAEEDIKNNIAEFEKQYEETLKKEKIKISEVEKATLKEIERKSNKKYSEMISRRKTEKQHEILKLKEELIKETLEDIKVKVKEYVLSNDYGKYLEKEIKKILNQLEENDYILYVSENDKNRFSKEIESWLSTFEKGKIKMDIADNSIIGGVIVVQQQGKFRIDNSLLSKLEESKYAVGMEITKRLQ